jgi:uronate dehydrogenase
MRVLLTGATGIVGRALRPYLAETYASVLLNGRSPIDDLRPNEVYERGDMCDPELMDHLVSQVDGVIHMAGLVGPDYTFEEALAPNLVAVYHLFEAARRHGVRRIIYASTHHAVGFMRRGVHIDHTTPPRADGWYGVTKACGEIIAAHAADSYGMDVMSIRIGSVGEQVPDERRVHIWCTARDLASLIQIGLTGPQRGYHLVYGVSRCPDPMFDNSYAESLGYRPQDCSLDYLSDLALAHQRPDPEDPEQRYVGGHFAARKAR